MVTDFLAEVAKKAAGRWFELLILPGALWSATVFLGLRLGHAHPFAVSRLNSWIDHQADRPGGRSAAFVLLSAVVVLVCAAAAGLAASASSIAIQHLRALPGWRGLPRLAVRFRAARWNRADQRCREAIAAAAGTAGPGRDAADRRVRSARGRLARLGATAPSRPTWIGDRFSAIAARIDADYGLDLDHAWPRLWAVLSDALRSEVTAAQDAYIAASRCTAWGVMYALVAVVWWPALVIGVIAATAGEVRSRTAATVLADLVCTGVEQHVTDLAAKVGVPAVRPFRREDGLKIMEAMIVVR